MRAEIFDLIRQQRGKGFHPDEVTMIDVLLDRLMIPRDEVKRPTSLKAAPAFYGSVRTSLFNGNLAQLQVDGMASMLSAMGAASWPVSFAAYALATAYHETAFTMQPIKEHGGPVYFKRMYDIEGDRPQKARELGNLQPGDGAKYAGRGFVQLTGRNNYIRAGNKIGVDLAAEPDKAMQCDLACKILVAGMEDGWFTGRRLADYLPADNPASLQQFANARRIINGTDKAQRIGEYAVKFQTALQLGGWA